MNNDNPARPAGRPHARPVGQDRDRAERVFVFGTWCLFTALLVWYVFTYSRNLGFWDDWPMFIGLWDGGFPGFSWAWAQNNEHRYPFGRLLAYASWTIWRDFRPVIVVSDLMLCLACLSLVRAVIHARGKACWEDAVLVILLLSWADFENLIFVTQHFFLGTVAFAVFLVAIIVRNDWQSNRYRLIAIVALVAILPFYGAMGILVAQPFVVWTGGAALSCWRKQTPSDRRNALMLAAGSASAVLGTIVYFVGYVSPPHHVRPRPDVGSILAGTAEILSAAFGTFSADLWPYSGYVVVTLVLAAVTIFCVAAWAKPEERHRAFGLVAGAIAMAGFALVVAYGRAGLIADLRATNRYVIFSAVLVAIAYVAFALYVPEGLGRFVRVSMFTLACVALVSNGRIASEYGYIRAVYADAVFADARAGVSAEAMAKLHAGRIYPFDVPFLVSQFETLRRIEYPGFGSPNPVRGDCGLVEDVPLNRVETHDMKWTFDKAELSGTDPYTVLGLPAASHVCGVRLNYLISAESGRGPLRLKVYWRDSRVGEFGESANNAEIVASPALPEQTTVFWIDSTIDQFRVDPDENATNFRLISVTLIKPGN